MSLSAHIRSGTHIAARCRGVLALLAAGVMLTGCGSAGDTTDTATSISGLSAPSSTGILPLGSGDSMSKTQRPEPSSQLVITGVRLGSHDGFDRVVFDLVGYGNPGWFINYTKSPARQGSNKTVSHQGIAALDVNIDGIVAPQELDLPDQSIDTVTGDGNVAEVQNLGIVDNRAQFIVGVNQTVPYSVHILDNPKRLVIDLVQTS